MIVLDPGIDAVIILQFKDENKKPVVPYEARWWIKGESGSIIKGSTEVNNLEAEKAIIISSDHLIPGETEYFYVEGRYISDLGDLYFSVTKKMTIRY